MNRYPDEQSVLVMDNCRIHHSEVLKEALNSAGVSHSTLLLPFSSRSLIRNHDTLSTALFSWLEPNWRIFFDMWVVFYSFWCILTSYLGKAYLRRHGTLIRAAEDPIQTLLDSCGCITADLAYSWFYHAGYIVDWHCNTYPSFLSVHLNSNNFQTLK